MYGDIIYEVARQRIADQHRAAVRNGEARLSRAAARARRARKNAAPSPAPSTPELLALARETVPAPRQEAEPGRRAGAGR